METATYDIHISLKRKQKILNKTKSIILEENEVNAYLINFLRKFHKFLQNPKGD